ncbi:hypothetical protein MKW98_001019 [Papaver atlanticum]|uniref:Uncharacterized protein n=1 Tax=Papaver atlanticum TaxID=357466 RepID=A0AAD4SEG2_9MAGN|nr:hypothetical protein MKW98_001019 [Papaver atlanticum]
MDPFNAQIISYDNCEPWLITPGLRVTSLTALDHYRMTFLVSKPSELRVGDGTLGDVDPDKTIEWPTQYATRACAESYCFYILFFSLSLLF